MNDNIYNDYELVSLAQEKNEDAINLIYKKYKPIIVKKSKLAIVHATHHGIDIADIMQEGFMGLDEAIKNFSEGQNASFYTFAMLCIDRQIINYLRKNTGNRYRALNDSINLDDALTKSISDKTNIELAILGANHDNFLVNKIRLLLTDFEGKVFDYKIKSYSYKEIAKILGKDVKSIYNTWQRIKTKIRENIQIDD